MREVMYDQSSVVIVMVLLLSMIAAIEIGFRFGRRTSSATAESKSQVSAIQASLLGVLGLMLAFTLSLALQRFDSRSQAVVDEANAIGTAWLRAALLPEALRAEARGQLRSYVELRIRAGARTLIDGSERAELLEQSADAQRGLWRIAARAAEQDGGPVTSGLFVQALNDVFDTYGSRNAALDRHVPELVLFLLYGTFLLTGTIVGYTSGLAGARAPFVTYVMVVLVVLLVFIIVDLDRPRRGLIEVDQSSLRDLRALTGEVP